MDDGSIAKNPNSNNRRPQRQPAVQRWAPYGHKRKDTDEGGPVVRVEVDQEGHDKKPISEAVEAKILTQDELPQVTENNKAATDQDML
jgi:hypothetical protein